MWLRWKKKEKEILNTVKIHADHEDRRCLDDRCYHIICAP